MTPDTKIPNFRYTIGEKQIKDDSKIFDVNFDDMKPIVQVSPLKK